MGTEPDAAQIIDNMVNLGDLRTEGLGTEELTYAFHMISMSWITTSTGHLRKKSGLTLNEVDVRLQQIEREPGPWFWKIPKKS